MKKFFTFNVILLTIVLIKSCDYDLTFSSAQTQDIGFSSDTVYLDTVFTSIGSSTYDLRIYNQSDRNVEIGSIRLGQGSQSQFRINVDGIHGESFEQVELLAKDSIYVFIETTVDIKEYTHNAIEFLYKDQLLVDNQASVCEFKFTNSIISFFDCAIIYHISFECNFSLCRYSKVGYKECNCDNIFI